MNRILLYIFLIFISSCGSLLQVNAASILGSDLGLDLYKSIDEGMDALIIEQFEYELGGQGVGSVKDTIDGILGDDIECDIEEVDDILTIADPQDENQMKTIMDKCVKDGEKISVKVANDILILMSTTKRSYMERATEKSKNKYELSRVGIYADGSDDNSPFDLISDIKKIDDIIFISSGGDGGGAIEYKEEWSGYGSDGWPCDDFFCVTIEYIMYESDLLASGGGSSGGGSSSSNKKSIESILGLVMSHFRRTANASLAQSKYTANNFELSTIIPDLSELLRGFSIEIIYMPVPIFEKSEDTEKDDNTAFSTKNILGDYYRSSGLDYKRKNDLNIIKENIEGKRQLQKSVNRSPTTMSEDNQSNITGGSKKSIAYTQKAIYRKTMSSDLKDFYIQFSELKRFAYSIKDFANKVQNIIKEMDKIPIREH